jgi:hypothetical protein
MSNGPEISQFKERQQGQIPEARLYAATYYARKDTTEGSLTAYTTDIVIATSEHYAKKLAFEACRNKFPASEGYTTHQYNLCRADKQIGNYRVIVEEVEHEHINTHDTP